LAVLKDVMSTTALVVLAIAAALLFVSWAAVRYVAYRHVPHSNDL
jgi:hypothetical protein